MQQNVISITLFAALLLGGGIVAIQQQRVMHAVEQDVARLEHIVRVVQYPSTISNLPVATPEEIAEELESINAVRDIVGRIVAISGETFVVETLLIDRAKVESKEYTDRADLPVVSKQYRVETNRTTEFIDTQRSDFAVNDPIQAFTESSVYDVNTFVATKIRRDFTQQYEADL